MQVTSLPIIDCTGQVSGAASLRWIEMQVSLRNAANGICGTDFSSALSDGQRLADGDLCIRLEHLQGSGASEKWLQWQ